MKERPLHHDISIWTLHFASELGSYQRYYERDVARAKDQWRSPERTAEEHRREVENDLLCERSQFLYASRSLTESLHLNILPPFYEPIHALPRTYFDDRLRALTLPARLAEPPGGGH